jgi:hypothetical protein
MFLVHESGNFQTTPFQKKSDFSQKIGFLGQLGHGLRNPIFPKKSSWVRLGTRFEKSYFPKKSEFLGTLHGLRNPIFQKNRSSWVPWARFEKSYFSKKSDFLGTFWVVWKLPLSCTSVAFSPNGKLLASGSGDTTVRLWNIEMQAPLGEPLTGHESDVSSVAFSPNSKLLASGSYDGTVMMWDIDSQSWLNKACQIANRNLSQLEWRKYFGDERLHQKTCPDLPTDTLGALELIK